MNNIVFIHNELYTFPFDMNEIVEHTPMTDREVEDFIRRESYSFSNRVISRCIDGRYAKDKGLPALAIPGADIGQIVMLFAVANKMKFILDPDKAFEALIEVVGGVENIRIHTDSDNSDKGIAAGCGYFTQVKESPEYFGVTKEQVDIIEQKFDELIKQGAQQVELHGDHMEEGALIIKGNRSIRPQGIFFVYHKTLVDERNRKISDVLFKDNEIMANSFYNRLSGTGDILGVSDEHFRKIKTKLKPNIPSFNVTFSNDGRFDLQKVVNI